MIRRRRYWYLFTCGFILGVYIGIATIQVMKPCFDTDTNSKRTMTILNDSDDDLEREDFLFVGVMTDRKFLDTRARAIHRTWAHRIPGKVVFFIGEGEPYKGDLNVVELKGVSENAYPPQKKSFAMLQFMGTHYASRYKWLMRADDDVYIKPDYLGRFLKGIDDRGYRYIGQPGYGRDDEKGRLGLSRAFCMGGPGVIMSSTLLKAILSTLPLCVHDVETSHEDTELGRCIAQSVGLPCTQAYEMQHLFYQNYKELHLPNSSFKKPLGQPELRAITLHPVKDAPYVFRLDNFIMNNKLRILEGKRRRLKLQTQIQFTEQPSLKIFLQAIETNTQSSPMLKRILTRLENLDNITSLPQENRYDHHPIHYWDCLKGTTIHSPRLVSAKMTYPARHRGRSIVKEDIIQTLQGYLKLHKKDEAKHQESYSFFQYQRLSPDKGILGLVFVNSKQNNQLSTRPFLYKLPFGKNAEFREANVKKTYSYPGADQIVMVMTVFQRADVYQNFLIMYRKAASDYPGPLELRVVIFKDPQEEHLTLAKITYNFKAANPNLNIEIKYSAGDFNRGKGLMDGLDGVSNSSLVLFMDSDMTFSSRFLQRVSSNTVRGQQAFFPIYFTHFDPTVTCYKKKDCNVRMQSREEDVGFWRSFSYGIASIYKSDVMRCGGFRTNITGWGLEDVELYENCLDAGLVMMRVIDPGIVHRYHARQCDESLPAAQLENCRASGAKMMGSVRNLGLMMADLGMI